MGLNCESDLWNENIHYTIYDETRLLGKYPSNVPDRYIITLALVYNISDTYERVSIIFLFLHF